MAYQALFSGKHRRWPAILIELGSSNLNFSTEATTVLMSQLALQAGPADQADPLRAVHKVFRDATFCKRLVDQLGQRLDGISSNWRETHCMEMLVSLILRLASLATEPAILDAAVGLVEKARAVTLQWIGLLRAEIHTATDAETSRRCSKYAFWAALLCRRTFTLHAQNDQNLPPTALCHFIECSITLQDNLVDNPGSLPRSLRNALIRDLKVVHRMRFVLRRSVEASPDSLMAAINTAWPEPEGSPPRSSHELEFLPNDWWIQTRVGATQQIAQQTIHYHLLEGHLFVDGRPLGKLPAEFRKSIVLHELFGDQTLLTFPSGLPGMTYVLAICMYGHQIHVGFRNGELIVRALANGTVLELVPREVFVGPSSFDLPASLVDDCVHWLDLRTGIMEIRKKPHIWTYKGSNWLVNIHTREAIRRTVNLVDPQSLAFQRIARLFDRFEYRRYLTLHSEIDPNQDAGTWYGLDSKLVLRDTTNPGVRSIIVPFGSIRYKRRGIHVAVEVMNGGSYGRFTINDVLGRLDCPAEPKLLYLKAQFHAYTSFVLPDPLTGRTGTEESLHCLKSGYCQPWTPLKIGPYKSLMLIAKLTPKRIYYPRDMKVMQQVAWDEQLTTTIQHDRFRPIVEEICRKSAQLSIFAAQKVDELPCLERPGDMHLLERSYLRRNLYERPNSEVCDSRQIGLDLLHDARDRCWTSQRRLNVFESTSLIRNWSSEMPAALDLAGILETWPMIGGYDRSFDKVLHSDRLSVQLDLEWGSLAKLCLASEPKDKFRLMFLFATMSFCLDIDMDIVRTLLAFAVLEDLKKLTPPMWPSYVQFRRNQIPHINYLLQLMKGCCVPYSGDERNTFEFSLSAKQRRKFEAAELAHERQAENDCEAVAQFLLERWPCPEPTLEGFSKAVLVDLAQAMQLIRPEWERLYHNMELSTHIQDVQLVLYQHRSEKKFEPPKIGVETQEVFPTRCRGGESPLLSRDLLRKTGPDTPRKTPIQSTGQESPHLVENLHQALAEISNDKPPLVLPEPALKLQIKAGLPACREVQELESIINGIMESQFTVRQQYGRDLMQSLNTLKTLKSTEEQTETSFQPSILTAEISKVRQALNLQFGQLCTAFERDDSCVQWLQQGGLWPCITPVTLLEQLRSTAGSVFGYRMKEALVTYATSITALQRLIRLKDAHEKNNAQRLAEEQKNVGHTNWQPRNHPDWLLLEIDANILIRPEQVDVALATISPASESNSVLQMNMGQGKFSV
ncbi:hypothetical protein H2201_002294 [Coniosporium apollinis]|uniref:ubiquitinyl hydrolase 1 n=1 Tax=Coniosporium apollinis TaxID=61459 RepID=A0ABQ9NYG5_9PEZI|nr:hypothetical protein H2201_002294 [Coniosporium apollinis]